MTNHNKHQRKILNFCIQIFFPTVTKSLPFSSHGTQEQCNGAGFGLKAWSKE
jgi:hypothetical protein